MCFTKKTLNTSNTGWKLKLQQIDQYRSGLITFFFIKNVCYIAQWEDLWNSGWFAWPFKPQGYLGLQFADLEDHRHEKSVLCVTLYGNFFLDLMPGTFIRDVKYFYISQSVIIIMKNHELSLARILWNSHFNFSCSFRHFICTACTSKMKPIFWRTSIKVLHLSDRNSKPCVVCHNNISTLLCSGSLHYPVCYWFCEFLSSHTFVTAHLILLSCIFTITDATRQRLMKCAYVLQAQSANKNTY